MPPNALTCPTQQQLAAFVTGKLDVTQSAEIEHHLADCQSCCQLLKMMPDEDTLVSLLRDPQAETTGEVSHSPLSPREAATLPPVAAQVTLPPSEGATEVAETIDGDALLSLPEPLRDHSRYRVTDVIGRGGMGDVYKAHHRMMNRPVALKVINAQLFRSHAAVQRFHREVQAAARLTHPNIVTAFDAEQAGDTHYLVMEYVDGVELAEVNKDRGPLPVAEACNYVRQAAIGLQHAHEQGMVHRDIKPQNLMLTSTGVVKILDFGLANLAGAEAAEAAQHESGSPPKSMLDRQLTRIGSMMGTPDYMAPEQAGDAHSADIRADIYSLGCTLYCLLAGKAPFSEGSASDKVQAHSQQAARPLSEFRDDVPAELASVISRMMNKSPAERFQTPIDVAKALEPFVGTLSLGSQADSKSKLQSRRSIVNPLTIVATLLLGFSIALAGLIVVVTDHGRLVIQSEVDDVQVVVKHDGKEITTIDLKTGAQVKLLSTGKYELELVGGDNDVKLDKTGFEMSRLGKVIVTARWNSEGRGAIHSFATDDPTITRDNVEVADGGWKITADGARTVRLFEVPMPQMKAGPFFYRAKLKTENVKVRAYLEMWVRFPGQGEFFSKGFHNAISGTNGWAEYEIPFLLKKGQQPDLVKLNLTIEGGGNVWIRDVELSGRSLSAGTQPQGSTTRVDSDEITEVGRFTGHEGWVYNAIVSPDGRFGISGGADQTVRVWDLASQEEARVMRGHVGSVFGLAISTDGKLLASSDKAKSIRVWDFLTGEQRAELTGHEGDVTDLAFMPDGTHLLSAGFDETLRLWDISERKLVRTIELGAKVEKMEPLWDGRRVLLSGAHTGGWGVLTYDLEKGERLNPQASALSCLAVSVDRRKTLIGSVTGLLRVTDMETGELIVQLADPRAKAAMDAAMSRDGRFAITTTREHQMHLWDLGAGRLVSSVEGDTIGSVTLSPDSRLALTIRDEGIVGVWMLPNVAGQSAATD